MVLRNVAKTFSLEEQRQEINEIAVDLDAVNTTLTNWNAGNWDTAYSWGDHAQAGYLTSYTETDPVFGASAASGIAAGDITNWNSAYGWGDHGSAGYATSVDLNTAVANSANWDTAYGWGDHGAAGYLTSYTEADTLATVTGRGASTTTGITLSTSNLILDSASDQRIQHNVSGTETSKLIFRNTGAIDYYATNGMSFYATNNPSPNNRRLTLLPAGGVQVEYQNSVKLETTAAGVTVTGALTAGGLTYPTTNGTSGQVLTSDGAGNVSWQDFTLSSDAPPTTASSSGTTGDIRYDADYVYICIATNTWKRAALATW